MPAVFDPTAPKKATNLSINSDLLRQAKEDNINLSQALEQRLIELLTEKKRRKWLEQNKEAIQEYNEFVRQNGAFSDALRRF